MIHITDNNTPAPTRQRACPVNRVVFTGDFLRPSEASFRPTQHENIQWLYKLLKTPIEMATGLSTEVVHWDNNWLNCSRIDVGTVDAIYRMMGLQRSILDWPQVFAATTLPAPFENLLFRLFKNSLVVGFELPPYLTALLDRHGIGYVDCSLSPVRFMDDILFELNSNLPYVTKELSTYAVSEAYIFLQAGIVSSNVAKTNPHPPRPNTLLLMLQTRYDKMVIENGRFVTILNQFDRLKPLLNDYDHVLIKEHPLEPQPETRDNLLKMIPRSQVTEDNFYRLVSHDNVKGVAALSSSSVLEARYFGAKGHYLLPKLSELEAPSEMQGFYIDDAVICPDFWRDILKDSHCPVSPKDGLRLPAQANRFRKQLRSAWSYNQIDTDIAVRWASKQV